MCSDGGELFNTGGKGPTRERIKILAISLAGADELGRRLKSVLQEVQSMELVLENLPDEALANPQSFLSGLVETQKASLLVLCLPGRGIACSEGLFEAVRKSRRELSIVVVLETAGSNDLERYISMGAADFCLPPLRLEDLVPRLMRWSFSTPKTNALRRQLAQSLGLRQFLGENPAFVEALQQIPRFARCDASVFIAGETGTGKEMCARAIHQLGPRAKHSFVPVNCGAIPSELVENELFGHAVGAFTGASSPARGLVHDAEGGTLFLDEIDSLPLPTQVKFLRFLQDREYRPLGSRRTCQADIRIIAASNADLEGFVRSGRFRADLFYRLNILPLKLPALRERREDIPLLARHFVVKYTNQLSLPMKELSRTALEKLLAYDWPGNVRELENTVERAIVLSEQPLLTAADIRLPGIAASTGDKSFKALKARAIAEFETGYVRQLLLLHDGNISMAARVARKNRRAFWQLMRKHNIVPPTTAVAH